MLKKKLSANFQNTFGTLPKNHKIHEGDSNLEMEDDEETEERDMTEGIFPQKMGIENELTNSVKEWIDPLLDLTVDFPRRITKNMLVLRMCIEKALKLEELEDGEVIMLLAAIERVKSDTNDNECIPM